MQRCALIDAHAHLDQLEDLPEALEEARAAGVEGIVAVGMEMESNLKVLRIAEGNRGYVYPAIGYHPWEVKEEEIGETLSFIRQSLGGCIALGEIGLDYKGRVKKDVQQRVFEALLEIGLEFEKPVILHCRYSHPRVFETVKRMGIPRAVFHWYSGPIHLLDEILDTGYYISATPALVYSPPHQEAIRRAPLERILLETDAPVVYGGRESRPKDVGTTVTEVARLKGADVLEVARKTTANASRFFGVPFGD